MYGVSSGFRALHVATLCAFAIGQPVFDLLARHGEFLVAHSVGLAELWILAITLGLGLPLGVAGVGWLAGRISAPLGTGVHLALVGGCAAAIALPLVGRAARLPDTAVAAAAVLAGLATAAFYGRSLSARRFVTALSPALLLFPALFLLSAPAAGLRATAAAGPAVRIGNDVPVVLVVFDALPLSSLIDPDLEIAADRLPHFAALARESLWFRNATTVSTHTNLAVPAILTGRYPRPRVLPLASEHPRNLFSLLDGSHRFNVVEPITSLCPATRCGRPETGPGSGTDRWLGIARDLRVLYLHVLLPQGWRRTLPPIEEAWKDFDASERRHGELRDRSGDVRYVFDAFLDAIDGGPAPSLHFLHVNLPHTPYLYLPSGHEYRPSRDHPNRRSDAGEGIDLEWAETQALQRHLLQVGYADTLLGRLVERLRSTGIYDRCVLVVTSDHGVSLAPGVESRKLTGDPATENPGDLLPVPLFVKLPAQTRGEIDERNAELVDILPTLEEVLELSPGDPRGGPGGRSLLSPAGDRPSKRVVYEGQTRRFGPEVATRVDTARTIARIFGRGRGTPSLFDVGPQASLRGRRVADLPQAPGRRRVELVDAAAFGAVDPDGRFVPVHVIGSLSREGAESGATDLAVSVNGVVRATTRSFEEHGAQRFTALVPVDSFAPGSNRVEVFEISDAESGAIVLRTTQASQPIRWAAVESIDGQVAALVSSDGGLVPVVPGAVRGWVTESRGNFAGRLVDIRRRSVAGTVLVFGNDALVHSHELGSVDLAEREHFRFVNPQPRQFSGVDGLRFFGIADDAAAELERVGVGSPGGVAGLPRVTLTLDASGARESLRASTGEAIPIADSPVPGRFTIIASGSGQVSIEGWIAGAERAPAALLLFSDGHFAGTIPANRPADPPSADTDPARPLAGFRASMPSRRLGDRGPHRLRLFAVAENRRVAELRSAGDAPELAVGPPEPPDVH